MISLLALVAASLASPSLGPPLAPTMGPAAALPIGVLSDEGLAPDTALLSAGRVLEPGLRYIERGPGQPPLYLPEKEELIFEVDVQITIFETAVAQCTMSSSVVDYRPPLLLGSSADQPAVGETAILKLHALGDHVLYSMDALMETRRLPQQWPSSVHRFVQGGSENRRREVLLGLRDGKPTSSYRRDTSRGAPRGTRIWVDPILQEVPPGAVDMVTGIYLVRTLIRDDLERLRFPMVDKSNVWDVSLRRGKTGIVETLAGDFRAVEVLMETVTDGGDDDTEFAGPFGLKGSIHLWVDVENGVPVLITGDLPAGILTLGVEIGLQSYSGTPPGFAPLAEDE